MRISKLAVIGAMMAAAAPAVAQETVAQETVAQETVAQESVAPAGGACTPPMTLTASRPTPVKEPAVPACVNQKTKTHTCRKGEIPKYNAAFDAEVDRYNAELAVYEKALETYLESATAFANCEVSAVNAAARKR